MQKIDFSHDEKDYLVHKVKLHFSEELNQEIGQFDAELLLEFFSAELGAYYYNQGLRDARAVLAQQPAEPDQAIASLEQATEFSR